MIVGMPLGVQGNVLERCGLPLRGAAYASGAAARDAMTVFLDAEHGRIPAIDGADLALECYVNGVYAGIALPIYPSPGEDGTRRRIALPGMRAGAWYETDLVGVTACERAQAPGTVGGLEARNVGARAALAWTDKPTDGDFAGYVIYWDEGDAGAVDTLLATVRGRENLEYTTDVLAAGTYQFALAYVDSLGNTSSAGTPASVTVAPPPLAVDDAAISYNATTRKATITWDAPTGETADVRTHLIFDNWLPGADAGGPAAGSEAWQAAGVERSPAGSMSWTSEELWAGVWRFAVRAMTAGGVIGDADELTLALEMDGADLVEAVAAPGAPELLMVWPLAGGAYEARFVLDAATAATVTAIWLLVDGVETDAVAVVAGQVEYTATGATLGDGVTAEITVRVYNVAGGHTESETLDVTTDAAAPTGDGVITGRVTM